MIKDEIPAEYLCPLSHQIMLDPVLAGDGENYEREEIEKYLATSKQQNGKWISPVHKTEMENQVLSNRPMKNIIEKFLSKHLHLKKEDMYFSEALVGESIAAIKKQNEKALQELVEKEPRLWSKALIEDKSLVALVCEHGNKELLFWLLKQIKQQNEIMEITLKSIDNLLLTCCRNMQLGAEGVKCWLEMLSWEGATLHQKVEAWLAADQSELVQVVVQTQLINVNTILDNKAGNTLLHLAVQFKQPVLVKWLMDNGADAKRTNTQGQRPEQLAEQCGNVELSKQIMQWRQAQKLAPYTKQIEALKRENSELQSQVGKMEQRQEQQDKAYQTLAVQLDKLLQSQKAYEEKLAASEYQIKALSDGANLLKARGFFASPQEHAKQNRFIKTLLRGNLEQARKLHEEEGASLIVAAKNGLYPLVAAVYSANPYLLKYIEEKLGKEADGFWAWVDEEEVKQKIKETTPEKRPFNAKYSWIAHWLLREEEREESRWWWKGEVGYWSTIQREEKYNWELFDYKHIWIRMKSDEQHWSQNRIRKSYYVSSIISLDCPSPEKHDEYVKTLTEQLETLEKYCLDKIAQAKKGIRLTM